MPVAPTRFMPKGIETSIFPPDGRHFRWNQPMNDNEEPRVTIITGRVWRRKGGKAEGVHIFLVAPDDDSAVRRALNHWPRKATPKPNWTRSATCKASRTKSRICPPTRAQWKAKSRS